MKMRTTGLMLLFCVSLIFAQHGPAPGPGGSEKNMDPLNKLGGILRQAAAVYKHSPRLTQLSLAKEMNKSRNRIRKQAGMPLLPETLTVTELPASFKRRAKDFRRQDGIARPKIEADSVIIDSLIDQTVQKRWNNPGFDVLSCYVLLQGSEEQLNAFNLKIRSRSLGSEGTLVQVEMDGRALEKVAALAGVKRITPILKKAINNDTTTKVSGARRIRLGRPGNYTKGYTGKGTIVGVIDTGIDWSHGDFINPKTGSSRVMYLWDTEAPATPGRTPADVFPGSPALSGLNYGRIWTRTQIDIGTCTAIDSHGHGTHVSGTAAGNGAATGKYTGMAPNADIVFVKGLDNNGILFIYEMAKLAGKPCAVNMSYGPSYPFPYMNMSPEQFPADGTSLDALMIKNWNETYGNGHIPVKSAGNHGHWNTYTDLTGGGLPYKSGGYHAGCELSGPGEFHLEIPNYSLAWIPYDWTQETHPYVVMSMWHSRNGLVSFVTPGGETLGPFNLNSTMAQLIPSSSEGNVIYVPAPVAQLNGEYVGFFYIEDYEGNNGYLPAAGQWKIMVNPQTLNSNRIDLWVWEWYRFEGIYGFLWDMFDSCTVFSGTDAHERYIFDEGASPFEICVGNYAASDTWNAVDGNTYTYAKKPWVGHIADSSAPGPARYGLTKPDVAAPGTLVRSAAGSDAGWTDDYLVDSGHGVMSGTSMAAPAVTGATALMLQKFPGYNVDRVRSALRRYSMTDTFTRTEGPNAFGAGKLWVRWLNDPPVAMVSASPLEVILDNPDRTITFSGAGSHDPEGFPLTYTFTAESDSGLTFDFSTDGNSAVLEPDPDNAGKYRVSLTVNDTITDSETVYSAWVTAKFYPVLPPVNASVQRLTNDYIFYKEYINRLSWQANGENKTQIINYRLYRKPKDSGAWTLIQTFAPTVFSWEERGLKENELFTYQLTSVNYRGKESDPVTFGN